MQNKLFSTRSIAEIAIFTALAVALNYVKLFNLPQGGSVTLVALPIVFLALRRGFAAGIISGLLVGLISFATEPYFMNVVQVFFDYAFAFAGLGAAGLLSGNLQHALRRDDRGAAVRWVVMATLLSGVFRFLGHFIAGWAFYADYAPAGQPAWLYSLIYNGSYMLPNTIIAMIVIAILVVTQPKLFRLSNNSY